MKHFTMQEKQAFIQDHVKSVENAKLLGLDNLLQSLLDFGDKMNQLFDLQFRLDSLSSRWSREKDADMKEYYLQDLRICSKQLETLTASF